MKTIKKILAITLSVIMALSVMSVCAFAEDEITDAILSEIAITVAAPVAGEYASGDYEFESVDYSITFRQWVNFETSEILYSSDDSVTPVDKAFEAGSAYVVCLTVAAEEGFVFDAAENLVVTVNGYDAQIVDISDDAKELSFTCVFECEEELGGDLGGDDVVTGGFDFSQIIDFIKTALLTFIRFLGSLIGLS